jgi:hypothetical protein
MPMPQNSTANKNLFSGKIGAVMAINPGYANWMVTKVYDFNILG